MSKNKQLVITYGDKQYTLEFTKDTVRKTENMGFKVRELFDYPANNIPILFRGAFLANHKWLQVSVIDEMYDDLPDKDDLINKLYEMYNEPIQALVGLEEDANKGKKIEVGGVVLDEDDSPDDERSYTDVFMEYVPYYMSLGMTWEEYWNGDNILPQIYRKKADLERDRRNIEDWRLGRYIMHAIGANMSEKNEYPDEPFPLTDEQAEQQAERQREQAYDDMLARFNAST